MIFSIIQKIQNFYKHLMVFGTMGLVSCSSTPQPSLLVEQVSMYADLDVNQNSALAVDLVMVYNSELMKTLSQMSASTYFASSRQLLLDNPTLLDIWHWELVPGQIVQGFQPPQDKGDAFGAFVFANYLTSGTHRLRVDPNGVVNLLLLKDNFKNLSALSASDVQQGLTMTTGRCGGGEGVPYQGRTESTSVSSVEASQGLLKLGPTITITPPCKKVAREPCANVSQNVPLFIKDAPSLPVTARPLAPLNDLCSDGRASSSSSYNSQR